MQHVLSTLWHVYKLNNPFRRDKVGKELVNVAHTLQHLLKLFLVNIYQICIRYNLLPSIDAYSVMCSLHFSTSWHSPLTLESAGSSAKYWVMNTSAEHLQLVPGSSWSASTCSTPVGPGTVCPPGELSTDRPAHPA